MPQDKLKSNGLHDYILTAVYDDKSIEFEFYLRRNFKGGVQMLVLSNARFYDCNLLQTQLCSGVVKGGSRCCHTTA